MKYKNIKEYYEDNDSVVSNPNIKLKVLKENKKLESITNFNSEHMPKLHLVSTSGLINDPNGLHKYGNKYYIYYQASPFGPFHLNKHWGLYVTEDFITYEDKGIVIRPDSELDRGGAFSGSAIVDDNNKRHIFYTGNIKPWGIKDLDRSANTIHYDLETNTKTNLFSVDKKIFHGHFRDPFPFKIGNDKYLINGAMKIGEEGTISLHCSKEWDRGFKYKGNINIEKLDRCWMIECPSFVKEDKNDLILFSAMRTEQFKDIHPLDPVVYAIGELDIENLNFNTDKIDIVDYGYDFYAPQIFNSDDRNIMIGWIGNTFYAEYKDANDGFNGMLSIPREINFEKGMLVQKPIKEFYSLVLDEVYDMIFEDKIYLTSDNIDNTFQLSIKSNSGKYATIAYINNIFKLDLSNTDIEKITTKNDDDLSQIIKINNIDLNEIEIIFDTSVIEIFLNGGEKVITQRIYLSGTKNIETNNDIKLNNLGNFKFI